MLPEEVDIAILGAGFTGLAAAVWLRRAAPEKTVAALEARRIGAGASGRWHSIAAERTAAKPDALRVLALPPTHAGPESWQLGI